MVRTPGDDDDNNNSVPLIDNHMDLAHRLRSGVTKVAADKIYDPQSRSTTNRRQFLSFAAIKFRKKR